MNKIYRFLIVAVVAVLAWSCTSDLDQKPVIGTTSEQVYATVDGYKGVLAKIYGSYTLVGQERAGNADLSSNQGQDLIRNIFNLQEGATDEVAFTWLSGDNLTDIAYMSWDANNVWVSDTYYRLFYSIALCNEFLRYCTPDRIGKFSADEQAVLNTFAAEARFIRALDYFFVLDLFRKGPKVDETTPTTGVIPEAYDGKGIYDFIVSEIADLENALPDVASYGRASKSAAWALGVRLALNGKIYTGEDHYTECVAYANKIIGTGRYSLENDYAKLFNAENHLRTNEVIFAFAADSQQATTWGSGTYLACGSCGNDNKQDPAKYGLTAGWGNWRVRGALPDLFENGDNRAMFFTDGQSKDFTSSLDTSSEGYNSEKWTNLTDAGTPSSDTGAFGADTDFPMFRMAEVYLSAAEAVLRGGQGMTRTEALGLVNLVRSRAFGGDTGKIADSQLTLEWILDERGREFYHEMHRRTDLVRFDAFTTSTKMWQWKGGSLDGRSVDARYNIFPIPAAELSANPNLVNELY